MNSWIKVSLQQVCSLVTDGTHHSPPNFPTGAYRYVTAKNIRQWGLDLSDISYVDEQTHKEIYSRCPVEHGDVLYIKDGVTTGLAAINTLAEPFSMLSSVALLKPTRDVLHPPYLKHWLNSPLTKRDMTSGMTGTAIKRLVLKQIRAAEIPLAPLNEQRRIADKLDTVLTRVDAVNTRLARVAPLLKRFRQSVLAAATSGRLTEEWRDEVGSRWEARTVPLGQLGEVVTGNTPSKKAEANFGGDIPFFKPSDLDAGYEVRTASEYLSALGARQARLLPERSVLVTCIGATIGKTGFARRPCSTNQQINAVICGEEVQAEWLYFWMCSPATQLAIVNNSSATTLPILNKSRFSALEVSVPSRDEQTEIVRRVEVLFAFANRLEARLQTAQTATDRLTPALLAKAFRGELVPQDPNDEPASELLCRLQATSDHRAPARAAGRGRKRSI